jgi:hypothetical protein
MGLQTTKIKSMGQRLHIPASEISLFLLLLFLHTDFNSTYNYGKLKKKRF